MTEQEIVDKIIKAQWSARFRRNRLELLPIPKPILQELEANQVRRVIRHIRTTPIEFLDSDKKEELKEPQTHEIGVAQYKTETNQVFIGICQCGRVYYHVRPWDKRIQFPEE